MRRVLFDIETNNLLPAVSTVHCICLIDVDDPAARVKKYVSFAGRLEFPDIEYDGSIEDALTILQSAEVLIGHNIQGYDLQVLDKLYPDRVFKAELLDTLLAAQVIWSNLKQDDFRRMRGPMGRYFPKNLCGAQTLEAWGYRMGTRKAKYGIGRKDWSKFAPSMLTYCAQDVVVNVHLFRIIEAKKFSPRALQLEHEFAKVMQWQERNGVGFDSAAAEKLIAKLQGRIATVQQELKDLFPPRVIEYETAKKKLKRTKVIPFNPGSRDQIAWHLTNKYGWVPTAFTDSGKPQVSEEVLEHMPWPEARQLEESLMLAKRLGALVEGRSSWVKLAKDGRIHGRVITNGAVSGRCTHSGPNITQVPANRAPYGRECRSLFIPRPGWWMVGWDASGLELRAMAHYLAPFDGGAYIVVVLSKDPHTANQLAAGAETRDQAKTFIYAYIYGAGDWKLGLIVPPSAEFIADFDAGKIPVPRGLRQKLEKFFGHAPSDLDLCRAIRGAQLRAAFEKNTPGLSELRAKIEEAVEERQYLIGLDRRILPVRAKHSALNTLFQSAGAVLVKQATVNVAREATSLWLPLTARTPNGVWAPCVHAHDEQQLEAQEKEIANGIGQLSAPALQSAGESFGFRCRLDTEYRVGASWADTH